MTPDDAKAPVAPPHATGSGMFSAQASVVATASRPPEVRALEARLDGFDQRLTAVEGQRERILEFSFQSILVVLTILALAAGVPFAILYGTKIASGDVAYGITALLFALVLLMIQWLRLWWRVNAPKR